MQRTLLATARDNTMTLDARTSVLAILEHDEHDKCECIILSPPFRVLRIHWQGTEAAYACIRVHTRARLHCGQRPLRVVWWHPSARSSWFESRCVCLALLVFLHILSCRHSRSVWLRSQLAAASRALPQTLATGNERSNAALIRTTMTMTTLLTTKQAELLLVLVDALAGRSSKA